MRRAIWANARCFSFAATVENVTRCTKQTGSTRSARGSTAIHLTGTAQKISEAPNAFGASHKTLQSRGSEFYFEGLGQSKTG